MESLPQRGSLGRTAGNCGYGGRCGNKGQCPGCYPGERPDGRCDVRLRSDADAVGIKTICDGTQYPLLYFPGRKMACGIGHVLPASAKASVDHHSNVHNKRICKDGPVFLAQEVDLMNTKVNLAGWSLRIRS